MYTVTVENETPKGIANRLKCDLATLVSLNKARQKGLLSNSQLMVGTQLIIPTGDAEQDGYLKRVAQLTDEVGYRHWTFINDDIEYTEASYMMAKKLRDRSTRYSIQASAATPGTYTHLFKTRTVDMAPLSTRIPLGCENSRVFYERHEGELNVIKQVTNPYAKVTAKAKKPLDDEDEKKAIPDPPGPAKIKVKKASAYLSYCAATRPILKVEHPGLPFGETTKMLAQRWAALSEVERVPFKEDAVRKKALFDEASAKYKAEVKEWKAECRALAKIRKTGKGVGGAAGAAYAQAAARAAREGWVAPEVPKSGKKGKKDKKVMGAKGSSNKAQPSKLFNQVVSLLGHEGLFFVLTYIPDLQWCHLGPMRKCGVFGNDKNGEPTVVTGRDKWMLCPEGTAQEWDVSAFNLRVVKTKTVRKTINADKEEWAITGDFEEKRKEWELGLNPTDIGGGLTSGEGAAAAVAAKGGRRASVIVANSVVSNLAPPSSRGGAASGGRSAGGAAAAVVATAATETAAAAAVAAANRDGALVGTGAGAGHSGAGHAGGHSGGGSGRAAASSLGPIASAASVSTASVGGTGGAARGGAGGSSSAAKRRRVDDTAGKSSAACSSVSAVAGNGGGSISSSGMVGAPGAAVVPAVAPTAQQAASSEATPVGLMAKQGTLSGWLRPTASLAKKAKEAALTEASMSAAYNPGDQIEANWCNKGRFYPGAIERVNPPDRITGEVTYAIRFVDGDYESAVPYTRTRVPKQKVVINRSRGSRGNSMET